MIILDYLMSGTSVSMFILLAVAVKLIQIVLNRWKLIHKYRNLPQSPCNPIFGHLLEFPGPNDAGLAFQRESANLFPRFNVAWLAQTPLVLVTHPDLVKIILKSSAPKAYSTYRFVHPWLGEGLLTSNGNKWAQSRRLLTPAFHFDILKDYVKLKNQLTDDLLCKFEKSFKTGTSLNVFDCISMFTLDVILQSTMSYETGCQRDGEIHPYIVAINRLIKAVVDRFLTPWLHLDFLFYVMPQGITFIRDCKFVHKIADEIITKRRAELESGKVAIEKSGGKPRKYRDFLDTLLTARDENGNGLTNREIRDEVDTFLFEGHDTTASAISWSLYSIAEHQDIQQLIQIEVDELFDGRESDCLIWEDLSKLPYLTKVIKESMRFHTPVPIIFRELTSDLVLDGYTVPKDAIISLCIYSIHHNPSVWGDTMKFDPERFSTENSEKRDPFAFVPFSAGPRNCIGQNFAMDEIKICLARILHRYEITLDPSHEVKKFEGVVMKAENDIKLCIKSRMSQEL